MTIRKFTGTQAGLKVGDVFTADKLCRPENRQAVTDVAPGKILAHRPFGKPQWSHISPDDAPITIWRDEPDESEDKCCRADIDYGDIEPSPSDGPEFRADRQAWVERQPKVTVAQIREFVNRLGPNRTNCSEMALEILDFIDNGPTKLTAEEVAEQYADKFGIISSEDWDPSGDGIRGLQALREAGLLKEDS